MEKKIDIQIPGELNCGVFLSVVYSTITTGMVHIVKNCKKNYRYLVY